MKITPSLDGVPRATVRVEFRIGREMLQHTAASILFDDPTAKLSRSLVTQRLRDDLHRFGVLGGFTYEGDEWDRAEHRAAMSMPLLFPEFAQQNTEATNTTPGDGEDER
jgi:hypothetical protein